MKIRGIVLFIAALAIPATSFAANKGDAAKGKAVYAAHCNMCHGPDGKGNETLAKMLKTTIPPLGSPQVQSLSDAQIKEVIEKGKGKMTAVRGLSAADIDNVIAYVRTFAKK